MSTNTAKEQINEQIQRAKKVKEKHGYLVDAVICKSWYSARKFHYGFFFENGLTVGYVGRHKDGSKYEVVAIV